MFKEASGFDSETEVIEHKSIDANGRPVHAEGAPAGIKWSNITLKRGVDESLDIWKWRQDTIEKGADKARVDGKIELLDIAGGTIATYQFKQGWPVKYVARHARRVRPTTWPSRSSTSATKGSRAE